jgi:hypothetical protein
MPTGIDQAIVQQYSSQFDYQFQQRIPRLRRFVRVKTDVIGNQTQFPVLGQSEMEDITGKQHAVTNWIDPQVTARWAQKQDGYVLSCLNRVKRGTSRERQPRTKHCTAPCGKGR